MEVGSTRISRVESLQIEVDGSGCLEGDLFPQGEDVEEVDVPWLIMVLGEKVDLKERDATRGLRLGVGSGDMFVDELDVNVEGWR